VSLTQYYPATTLTHQQLPVAGAPLLPRRIELRLDELGRNGDVVCARFSVMR
jgi:hypothetical protein